LCLHLKMKNKQFTAKDNIIAIILVSVFVVVYIVSQCTENAFLYFGTTGIKNLNGEYYRWLTCLFLHYNLRHLLANSIALLVVGYLLAPFLKKRQTLFLFLSGGMLSEIAFSAVCTGQVYDIGASGGIFALLATLLVCHLRYPEKSHFTWYRPDVLFILLYFVFANSSTSAFLVHTFGFTAGILISFLMVSAGLC